MHQTTNVVLTASSITGDKVRNTSGEDLGKIEEVMVDVDSGRIAYAVLSFGGFLGMGEKLFAIPWDALSVDFNEHEFILDVDKKHLENAPGFDKDQWPRMADRTWGQGIYDYYGFRPHWEQEATDNRELPGPRGSAPTMRHE